jgi:peptidoglycan/LPS O-acetylase OafA/YrhL
LNDTSGALSPPQAAVDVEAAETLGKSGPAVFRLGYRPGLDGLRACAILMVVGGHAWLPDMRAVNSMVLFIGVDLFFVLSGFLITALLLEEWSDLGRISLKRFYARRALRLLPALLAVIVVCVLFQWLLASKAAAIDTAIDGLLALFYISNWAQALETGRPHLFLSHTWSLSIEEQFYLLWPLTLLLLLRRNRKSLPSLLNWVLLLIFLSIMVRVFLVTGGANFERIRCGTDTRADSLLIGCALAVVLWSGWRPAAPGPGLVYETTKVAPLGSDVAPTGSRLCRRLAIGAGSRLPTLCLKLGAWLSVLALAILATDNRSTRPFALYWFYPAISIFAALIILELVSAPGSLLNRLLSLPWLVYIGRLSYGLYLWHIPVFRVIHARLWPRGWEVTVELVLSFAITLLSFYLIETPALRLKQRFRKQP